ncbi:MAG TPA: 5'/3'-nucleotidase SurE [Spirochaetota bacterium]|nr:5'/3'-nucleotidase SurE [Spirochaetota bacterium]
MRILLTNDDGVSAAGINILFDILSESHDVYMVAPLHERSACSNAITVRTTIPLREIARGKFAADAFTADCVNIGINGDILPDVDLVISGINHGPNLGDDIHFSGTVAGARSAVIFGKPGIAISLDCFEESDYFADAGNFLLSFIDNNIHDITTHRMFFNINYPDIPHDEIKGTKYTTLGRRSYCDTFRVTEGTDSTMLLEMEGTIQSDMSSGTDTCELRNGYISITPLLLDCTDKNYLQSSVQ